MISRLVLNLRSIHSEDRNTFQRTAISTFAVVDPSSRRSGPTYTADVNMDMRHSFSDVEGDSVDTLSSVSLWKDDLVGSIGEI